MRIAVTGSSGAIGSVLCDVLRERGHVAIPSGDSRALNLLEELPRVSAWFEDARPDAVVHLAGAKPPSGPERLMAANAGVTFSVMEALARSHVSARLLLVSTAAAYAPVGIYGASKRAAEWIASEGSNRFGIPLVIGRVFNVIGAPLDRTSLLADSYSRLVAERPSTLTVRDGDAVRDFVDVRDVCLALCLLAENANIRGTVDIGAGVGTTVEAFVRLVCRELDLQTELRSERWSGSGVKVSIADPRALADIGWTPTISIEESIRRFVAYRSEACG